MQRLRSAAGACRRLAAAHGEVAAAPPPWARQLHVAAPQCALGKRYATPALHLLLWRAQLTVAFARHAGRGSNKPADMGDPLVLQAQLRDESGRLPSARQRKAGRIPAVVFNQARRRARSLASRGLRACGVAQARRLSRTARLRAQYNEEKLLITLDARDVLRRVRGAAARRAAPRRQG
jgi:hypothetical protein